MKAMAKQKKKNNNNFCDVVQDVSKETAPHFQSVATAHLHPGGIGNQRTLFRKQAFIIISTLKRRMERNSTHSIRV
jgi:hypothetical protein